MESSAATGRAAQDAAARAPIAPARVRLHLCRATGDQVALTLSQIAQGASRMESNELHAFREHALAHGVNPVLYWLARAVLIPFFLLYFRIARLGREHIPAPGPCCWQPTTAAFSIRS